METKEERLARGHPIGQDVPYAAMGGITGFSSLMDGYMRLDDSGIGPPPLHMLEQPISKSSQESYSYAGLHGQAFSQPRQLLCRCSLGLSHICLWGEERNV